MPVPNLGTVEAADAVSAAHRELGAVVAALTTRVAGRDDVPFGARQEVARCAMIVEFEANRLAEILPALRRHAQDLAAELGDEPCGEPDEPLPF